MKKLVALFLAAIITVSSIMTFPAYAAGEVYLVQGKSKEDIVKRYLELLPDIQGFSAYAVEPKDTVPYSAGKIEENTKLNGLKVLNFLRYLADVGDDISLMEAADVAYTNIQNAMLINAVNNQIAHMPEWPEEMSEAMFYSGAEAAINGNITMESNYFPSTPFDDVMVNAVTAFLDDSDEGNFDRLGHRRKALDPTMRTTDFGAANSSTPSLWGYNTYVGMVTSNSKRDLTRSKDAVYWPATGYFPFDFFSAQQAWSVSLEGYDIDQTESVKVTFTDTATGTKEIMNASQGEFTVNTGTYGSMDYCVIFRPNGVEVKNNSSYHVKIEGLVPLTSSHKPATIEYDVSFFSLSEVGRAVNFYLSPAKLIGNGTQAVTVTALDNSGTPLPNIDVTLNTGETGKTNASGVASIQVSVSAPTKLIAMSNSFIKNGEYFQQGVTRTPADIFVPMAVTLPYLNVSEVYPMSSVRWEPPGYSSIYEFDAHEGKVLYLWSSDGAPYYTTRIYLLNANGEVVASTPYQSDARIYYRVPSTQKYYVVTSQSRAMYGYSHGVFLRELEFNSIDIYFPESPMNLLKGERKSLSYSTYPENVTFESSWSSSNSNVAAIQADGRILGKNAGTAVITLSTSFGETFSFNVNVSNTAYVAPTGVTITPNNPSIFVGKTQQLSAAVAPNNATYKSVTWSSSNTGIATISETGLVTGKAQGTAVITARTVDGNVVKTTTVTIKNVDPTGVTIAGAATRTINVGDELQLDITVAPTDATIKTLALSISNNEIVSVSAAGKVKGLKAGTAAITVKTVNGKTAKVTITVNNVPPKSITLRASATTIGLGETSQITASILPANTTIKTLTWSSSNTAVATVDSNGKVTGLRPGTIRITASTAANNGNIKNYIDIRVTGTLPTGISIAGANPRTLTIDTSTKLSATITPSTATNKTVTWSSDNTAIATVDSNGNVYAKAVGETYIKATSFVSTVNTKIKLVVSPIQAQSLAFINPPATIGATESEVLQVAFTPANTTNKNLTWSSSNTSVARVDSTGSVTGLSMGTAMITAKASNNVTISTVIEIVEIKPYYMDLLNENPISLAPGSVVQLLVQFYPENTSNKGVTWKTNKPTTATVDENGLLTIIGATGTATITCTADATTASGGTLKKSIAVNIESFPPTAIQITNGDSSLFPGETLALDVAFTPAYTNIKSLTWSSSNEAAATVDSAGVITAVGEGIANITALSSNGLSSTAAITVTIPPNTPVQSLSINKTELSTTLKVGEEQALSTVILPVYATDKAVIWSSDNQSVLTVDQGGRVQAVGKGKANITVKTADEQHEDTIELTVVVMPAQILISGRESIDIGEELELYAAVLPENADFNSITWSIDKPELLSYDSETGLFTGLGEGTAVITASTANGVSAEHSVTIVFVPTQSMEIIKDELPAVLGVDSWQQVSIGLLPLNASDKIIVWSSSNEEVLTVDETGAVFAVSNGTATIHARTPDGQFEDSVEFTVMLLPSSVEITGATDINVGDKLTLTAEVLPEDADDKSIEWSVDNEEVLRIDDAQTGEFTALSEGIAIVTARALNGEWDTHTVLVNAVSPESVSISNEEPPASLEIGGEYQLYALIQPENTTDKSLAWSSDNEAVLSVDQTGKVTAIGQGKAKIYVKTANEEHEAYIEFTVLLLPESVEISGLNVIEVGGELELTATVLPSNADDTSVTWSVDEPEILSYNEETGKFTGESAGTAVVTAETVNGLKASHSVEVGEIAAQSITIDFKNNVVSTLSVGDTYKLSATVLPENAADKTVIWSSEDSEVVTVTENGLVRAVGGGSAKVYARTADDELEDWAEFTVNPILAESITIEKTELPASLEIGEEIELLAEIQPENATDKTVIWRSENEEILAVDSIGKVTAIGQGTAKIYAEAQG
ncbi:MAG: Ig-like domain-containing protein, partial [Oscillospiraceae bacterium]|nr:Ig-like domain-containing protein [Oscillospiraceae bacterium]